MIKTTFLAHRWRLLAISLLSAAAAGLTIVLLNYLHQTANGSVHRPLAQWLPTYALGVAALFSLSLLANLLLVKLACGVVARLRETLVHRIVHARYADIERAGKGRLLATLTDDIENMSEGMGVGPQCLFNLVTVVLCLGYLLVLSYQAFALFFAILSVGVALTMAIVARGNRHFERYRRFKDEYYRDLHAMFDGAKEIAIDTRRRKHFLQREVLPAIGRLREAELRRELFWNLGEVWARAFLFIALGVAVVATQAVGSEGVSLTMSYFVVITFIAGPIESVVHAASTLSKAWHSSRVVAGLGIEPPDSGPDPVIPCDWKEIRFDKVAYQWRADGRETPFHFGPVSLAIRRGEVLFLTGGNGSGKSTFAKLLLGLYPRESGSIQVDDCAIGIEPGERYRGLFAAVFADYHLFPALLASDGTPTDDATTQALLQRVGMAGQVAHRDGVLASTTLSQGQRKRLALVQAWLQAADVYLLDEWAADQDPAAREHFYSVVLPQMQREGKTLVVISHDDRYFHLADRVATFEQGRVRTVHEAMAAPPPEERAAAARAPQSPAARRPVETLEQPYPVPKA